MDVVRQMDFPDAQFSNYFLCNLTESQRAAQPAADGPEARAFTKGLWQMTLELTHNHGTQDDPSFAVHNGNDAPVGFGHIGFLVDDLEVSGPCMHSSTHPPDPSVRIRMRH